MKIKANAYDVAYKIGIDYLKTIKQKGYFGIEKPAVMFDIDDTLITNTGKAIPQIIKLLNKCIKDGLLVIIITARGAGLYNYTVEQLKFFKINYSTLILRNPLDDINTFKSKNKEMLALVYDINIVLSIGDNLIDINGEYSGFSIKLPNTTDPTLYKSGEADILVPVIF